MQFKTPQGDIWWWCYLWLLAGIVLSIYGPIRGDLSLTIAGVIALVSVFLIWSDQKWIAPPMIIMYLLAALTRILLLFAKGFTLTSLGKLIMPLYFAYLFWEWYRSEEPGVGLVSPSELARNSSQTGKRRDPFSEHNDG